MKEGNLAKYAFRRKEYEVTKIDLRKASQYDIKALNKERKRLAKVANQRLRGIEEAGETEGYVYSQTMQYLFSKDRARFIESNRQMNLYELKDELEELNAFLRSKTSTIGGIREYQRKMVEVFRDKFEGLKLKDVKKFSNFLSSEIYRYMIEQGFGSEFLIEFYDRATEAEVSQEDIYEALEAFRKKEIYSWDELYNKVGLNFVDYL